MSLSSSGPGIELVDGLDFWVVGLCSPTTNGIYKTPLNSFVEGYINVRAFAQDPSIARVVDGSVSIQITGEEVVFNPTYSGTAV